MLCSCGQQHADTVTQTVVGSDISPALRQWLRGYTAVLLVADVHTAPCARALQADLAAFNTRVYIFDSPALVPDETALGKLLLQAQDCDALLVVGSGTLNDLARYVSFRLGLPYWVAATAASMDGYTSGVAPLITGGMKVTFSAAAPLGVAAHTGWLNDAPPVMTAAGYGDMMGKYTSVLDWELESLVLDSHDYCPVLADEMRRITAVCAEAHDAEAVIHALLSSGLVMQRAGHSKPASGSEHHLSHFWEMRALGRGHIPALHGAKVGVATLISLRAAAWLRDSTPDWSRAFAEAARFDAAAWRDETRRVYRQAAAGILALWTMENSSSRTALLEKIQARWPQIQGLLAGQTVSPAQVEAGLIRMGGPTRPGDLGVGRQDVTDGIRHAFRLRQRFTVWRLADLLGLLPEFAKEAERVELS